MGFKERIKKQTCVHWAKTGTDSRGRPEFATPVEKDCRWSDVQERYFDTQKEERISKSVVFVDDVNVGDVLYLGELTDSGLDQDDPLKNAEAWQVKGKSAIPNLKASVTWYKVYI